MTNIPQIEKIKISSNLWITFRGNKIVFGDSKNKIFHHTVSFGNKSGYFDLHVTNQKTNEHTTIIRWNHENAQQTFPYIFTIAFHEIFKSSAFDFEKYAENNALNNNQDYNIYTDFQTLIKKNQIKLNQEDPEFKAVVNKLCDEAVFEKVKVKDLVRKNYFLSLVETENEEYIFILKNQFLDKIYKIDSIDLNLENIMRKIFGDQVYEEIILRIESAAKH